MRFPHRSLGLIFSAPLLLTTGCNETPPTPPVAEHAHDEHAHHHPETLAEAVTEVIELRDTIRDAFTANDPDKAHDPLHEVGHLLETVSDLAKEEKLSDEKLAIVKSSVETLMQSFGEIDKSMHGQEGASYKDVSTKIDDAVKALTELNAPAPEAPAPEAEAPKAETPAVETPAAETPAAETPAAETPAAETPAPDAPAADEAPKAP